MPDMIHNIVYQFAKQLREIYGDELKKVVVYGSYARGEADENSDLDFLVFGGEGFKLTSILALGEELREVLKKKVDIFEIREVNQDSEFYRTIMREKVFVA